VNPFDVNPYNATPSNSRGFTLIEVLAALVIVSLGMLAVIQAVSQTANNSAYLRDKTIAHWVAMNRVTEMRLAAQGAPTGDSSGEVEMAGRRWRWSAQVIPTALPSMRRIDVSVSTADEEAGEANKLAIITGFVGDKIAPPGKVIAQFDAPEPANPGQQGGQPGGQPPLPRTGGGS